MSFRFFGAVVVQRDLVPRDLAQRDLLRRIQEASSCFVWVAAEVAAGVAAEVALQERCEGFACLFCDEEGKAGSGWVCKGGGDGACAVHPVGGDFAEHGCLVERGGEASDFVEEKTEDRLCEGFRGASARFFTSLHQPCINVLSPCYAIFLPMPLRLKLPHGDRIIVNGAVLENGGEATMLVFHNHADIMRRKEIMQEADALSPSRRVYYALQCAYIFEQKRDSYLEIFERYLCEYENAAPSSASIAQKLREILLTNKIYLALKECRNLIQHESDILALSELQQKIPSATPATTPAATPATTPAATSAATPAATSAATQTKQDDAS